MAKLRYVTCLNCHTATAMVLGTNGLYEGICTWCHLQMTEVPQVNVKPSGNGHASYPRTPSDTARTGTAGMTANPTQPHAPDGR